MGHPFEGDSELNEQIAPWLDHKNTLLHRVFPVFCFFMQVIISPGPHILFRAPLKQLC